MLFRMVSEKRKDLEDVSYRAPQQLNRKVVYVHAVDENHPPSTGKRRKKREIRWISGARLPHDPEGEPGGISSVMFLNTFFPPFEYRKIEVFRFNPAGIPGRRDASGPSRTSGSRGGARAPARGSDTLCRRLNTSDRDDRPHEEVYVDCEGNELAVGDGARMMERPPRGREWRGEVREQGDRGKEKTPNHDEPDVLVNVVVALLLEGRASRSCSWRNPSPP